jgi:hypothetical protein
MKKIIILIMLAVFSGITLNCSQPAVPQNSFRVKTRVKFSLGGIPLPFSVPNPEIAINLKTSSTAGTSGTTGTTSEFAPGGGFVVTSGLFSGGYYDAMNAVTPAFWIAKVAPNQNRCRVTAGVTDNVGFNVVNGGTYKINCGANITVQFLVQPSSLDLSNSQNTGGNGLTGIQVQSGNGEARFANASNLKVRYYKHISGEDYELDQYHPVISVSADGKEAVFPIPEINGNHGLVNYKLLFVEDDSLYDSFIGYGDLQVIFPLADPPPPCGGGGEICQ